MKQNVYVDNAATTKLDDIAFEEMRPFLLDYYGNASQLYSFSKKARKALKIARGIIAKCINADEDEIFFTSCGTESDNWALKGIMCNSSIRKTLITTKIEHHAILNTCDSLERKGYIIKKLNVTNEGIVLSKTLKDSITSDTQLVSIMLANNEIGTIQSIRELAKIAHENGSYFHTDAVQAVGHVPIDVKALDVDLLSASAHKFNGPKGIGFLYIKKGVEIEPLLDGGNQEFSMRAGTENVAAIIGMATALKNNIDHMPENMEKLKQFENLLIRRLEGSKNIKFVRNGSKNGLPGLISLSFMNADGEALLHRLDLRGIYVSTGSACNSVKTEVSHVLESINLDNVYSNGTIRISFGKYNTIDDVNYVADEIIKVFETNNL